MDNGTAAPQGDTGSAAGAAPSFIESLGETYAKRGFKRYRERSIID